MAKPKTPPAQKRPLVNATLHGEVAEPLEALDSAMGDEQELPELSPGTTTAPIESARSGVSASGARVYRNAQSVEHDLFKLDVATMRKNISFIEDSPEYAPIEHVHIFHTVDSDGKKQTQCTSVGGHHHDIEVMPCGPGEVPEIRVSGPRKWVRLKRKGRVSTAVNPPDEPGTQHDQKGDFHTHTVSYLGSERIKLRTSNMEFAKMESAVNSKINPPSIEGIL